MIEQAMAEGMPQGAPQESPQGAPQEAQGENDPMLRATLAERKILYTQPTSDKVLQILQGSQNAGESLAVAAGMVLKAMSQATKGGKLPGQIAEPLIDVLLKDLAELGTAAGMTVAPEDVEMAKQALTGGGQPQQPQQPQEAQQPQAQPAQPQGLISGAMGA